MTIVYIATSGDYSDYRIQAVFLSKRKAKKYSSRTGCEIEEWEADSIDEDWLNRKVTCWDIWINVATSDIYKVEQHDGNPVNDLEPPYIAPHYKNFCIHVLADTQERAVKVAMERRARWLALEEGARE